MSLNAPPLSCKLYEVTPELQPAVVAVADLPPQIQQKPHEYEEGALQQPHEYAQQQLHEYEERTPQLPQLSDPQAQLQM